MIGLGPRALVLPGVWAISPVAALRGFVGVSLTERGVGSSIAAAYSSSPTEYNQPAKKKTFSSPPPRNGTGVGKQGTSATQSPLLSDLTVRRRDPWSASLGWAEVQVGRDLDYFWKTCRDARRSARHGRGKTMLAKRIRTAIRSSRFAGLAALSRLGAG